jgi:hypothetical protein
MKMKKISKEKQRENDKEEIKMLKKGGRENKNK